MTGLARDPGFFALLSGSHARLLGRPLVPEGRDAVWLYEEAPFAVLAHDGSADPRFVYANRTAQSCFGYGWAAFTALPSRLSAEAPHRASRRALLERVAREGFATGYRGLRVAASGRRFWIEDGTVWQLIDVDGTVRGQAAWFARWHDA
ncbi:hypothetical protein J2X36_004439 [Methylobacterium sp. BE186]|uniref:MEKHLA domain-containing protein n=1 Tax=Methylobacterium sp. BE186 TaxID=2817715 RepID=UPI00285C08CA|nr:MEKHLA domain-containing protein [Methylobacterium sp. BE186]MDR7039662.1 hypothetical protein [Methylobacterium sp. BE186]